jgi:hypothetical protein
MRHAQISALSSAIDDVEYLRKGRAIDEGHGGGQSGGGESGGPREWRGWDGAGKGPKRSERFCGCLGSRLAILHGQPGSWLHRLHGRWGGVRLRDRFG